VISPFLREKIFNLQKAYREFPISFVFYFVFGEYFYLFRTFLCPVLDFISQQYPNYHVGQMVIWWWPTTAGQGPSAEQGAICNLSGPHSKSVAEVDRELKDSPAEFLPQLGLAAPHSQGCCQQMKRQSFGTVALLYVSLQGPLLSNLAQCHDQRQRPSSPPFSGPEAWGH
jgi:hypothetical protein